MFAISGLARADSKGSAGLSPRPLDEREPNMAKTLVAEPTSVVHE